MKTQKHQMLLVDLEQPQMVFPFNDINLGAESFPSSMDSTVTFSSISNLRSSKKFDTFLRTVALGRRQLVSQEQERVLGNIRTF